MLRSLVAAALSLTVATAFAHAQAPGATSPAPAAPAAPGTPAAAPPATAPAPALDPKTLKAPRSTPELLAKGKASFEANCVTCHGTSGHGDGPAGLYMSPRPRDFAKDPLKQGSKVEELFVTVTLGVKDTAMVGFGHLSEEERWGLSHYVATMLPQGKGKKAKKTP